MQLMKLYVWHQDLNLNQVTKIIQGKDFFGRWVRNWLLTEEE